MRTWFSIPLFILLNFIVVNAKTETITFLDSLTNSVIVLPEYSKVKIYDKTSYKRADIEGVLSVVQMYAQVNQANNPFSWNKINEFDANNKYGRFIESKPVSNDIDGWTRHYISKDEKGQEYIRLVTLISGYNYAFYIVETLLDMEYSVTDKIMNESTFVNATKGEKEKLLGNENLDIRFLLGCLFLIVFPFCCIPLKKHDGCLLWSFIIILPPILFFLLFYFGFNYKFGMCIFPAIINFIITLGVFSCSSWTDVWNFIRQVINNI